MDTGHRAKIFSAFDALAGFGDRISDKEVPYCDRRILSEGERDKLNRRIAILWQLTYNGRAARKNRPQITAEYFSPCTDENSFAYGTGGTYKTVTGICRKVDMLSGFILIGENRIPIEDIAAICGPVFDM